MSWDVLIMKEKYDFDAPEDKQPAIPPLGQRDEIIGKLTSCIPELDYRDAAWGFMNGEGYSIEFNTGDEETVDSIMLHIRGGGTVMDTIQLVCDTLEAYALNTSDGSYINFEQPEEAEQSWEQFQKYRDQVIKEFK
ncbi:hypothetical protein HQN87_22170 [Paenibacillus tritici]|uniref:Uncharacterized protein n=1 Tax=Paenibacillus tritici TaxID=1873425 RepID=A0ABX2DX91_9BACL|nr:hypothetical protein [Paenibacillus tritici]NQX48036.1 hypothetical protein [Paenibacillus tritici]